MTAKEKKEQVLNELDTTKNVEQKKVLDHKYDPKRTQATKQRNMDSAAEHSAGKLQITRRVARELAVNGPITMDDVNRRLTEQGMALSDGSKDFKKTAWKGSVFKGKEWVKLGFVPSTNVNNHGRPLILWAHVDWYQKNGVNGTSLEKSCYKLRSLHREFFDRFPKLDPAKCEWYIGLQGLAPEFTGMLVKDNGDLTPKTDLYGTPVKFVEHAVGAMICPPNPNP